MSFLWSYIIACCLIMLTALAVVDRLRDPVFKLIVGILCAFAMVGAFLGILISLATAAETGQSTRERSQWFRSLERPDVGGSCCDISDCHQTSAEWRGGAGGQWFAAINGRMRAIRPELIVKNPVSIDGEAYVCHGADIVDEENPSDITLGQIFCFIPPSPGS